MLNPEQPKPAGAPPGTMAVTSRKMPTKASEEPPIYINAAEFSGMGMEVIMDVGVVSVESVNAALTLSKEKPGVVPTVDFYPSFRFGMSIQSAIMIHQKLTYLIQQATSQVQAELTARSQEGGK